MQTVNAHNTDTINNSYSRQEWRGETNAKLYIYLV